MYSKYVIVTPIYQSSPPSKDLLDAPAPTPTTTTTTRWKIVYAIVCNAQRHYCR